MQTYYHNFIEEKNTMITASGVDKIVYLKSTYGHIFDNYTEELIGHIHQLEIVSEDLLTLEQMVEKVKNINPGISQTIWIKGSRETTPLESIFGEANKQDLNYGRKIMNKAILTKRVECSLDELDISDKILVHKGLNL